MNTFNNPNYRRITTQALYDNLKHFKSLYSEDGKREENPVPENTHCFVYCSNGGSEEGFLEIESLIDLGLYALIVQSWITATELKQIVSQVKKETDFTDPTIDTVGKCANCGVEFHIHKNNEGDES